MDTDDLIRFLTHCANVNCPVLVHPWDMMDAGGRMDKYMLKWLVAMAAETQLSIMSMILSGGFEKIPKSLRICYAHGGGSFAFLLGRADNAWKYRDIIREDCPHPPSHYTDRFFVDSAVFEHKSLKLLTDIMGEDRVMFGTDHPFPLGEQEMGKLIKTSPYHNDTQKQQMLWDNAFKWLGI